MKRLLLHTIHSSRRGFTLVELAIVLVVIGLLIGGLLVGKSLVSASYITSFAAQIQQFDAGVMSFKSKYNYLPGDAPAFGGDGNGAIDLWQNQVNLYSGDISNFWNNLNPLEYSSNPVARTYPGTPIVTTGPTKNVPMSKLGVKGSVLVVSACCGGVWHNNSGSYYGIIRATLVQNTTSANWNMNAVTSANSAVTPIDALSLGEPPRGKPRGLTSC